jgi:hypothetical protein
MHANENTNNYCNLKILQCNLHKSNAKTHSILNDPKSAQFAVLLLQEQNWSNYTNSSLLHPSWTVIESTTTAEQPPRTAIYVNNKILRTSSFQQTHIPFSDVTAITIMTNGENKATLLINVYNPRDHDLISPLRQYLHQHINTEDYETVIMAGDFNLHHPMWNPQGYTTHDSQADELVEMMADHDMRLLLPPGTVTFPNAGTTIDLVWGNESAERTKIKCQISEDNDHGSDHLPIETILDLQPRTPGQQTQLAYNYAKTDWKTLEAKLSTYLPDIINTDNSTPEILDQFAVDITKAFQKAVDETTPRKKQSPFSKRWWNDELTQLRKETNRRRNRYRRSRNELDKEEWKNKLEEYEHEMKRAKEKMWRDFVEEANERTIWTVKKYIDSTPTPAYIPTLNNENATSNEEKATAFRETFFPPPPRANLSDIRSTEYPQPVECATTITLRQIQRAVNKLAPNKAPGPDEIQNIVLKKTLATSQHHIHALAQTSFNTGHFPTTFKTTTTVILRKPCKPDYTKPNAYRPIALENTLGKVLESIAAELISYLTETHDLLPPEHFGGRPGRTAEDAMIILSEKNTCCMETKGDILGGVHGCRWRIQQRTP